MGLVLLILFIGLPIAEIAVFIRVGEAIGLWPTLLAVIATGVLGTALVRAQGLRALRQVQASLDRGETPVAELFTGMALLAAGFLLLLPGFITDAVGFLLLVPPLRRTLGVAALLWLTRNGGMRVWRSGGPRDGAGPAGGGTVIDADYVEVDPDRPDRAGGGRLPDGRDGTGRDRGPR